MEMDMKKGKRNNMTKAEFKKELKEKGTGLSSNYWKMISAMPGLTESFMERHAKDLDWPTLFLSQEMSDEFIKKHKRQIFFDPDDDKHCIAA